uniref:P-loop containing nucleoside triphosphate hydrolase protein n=1 Tax=Panagrellus redivivus TaxID=6233 RepID=A0A7E4UUZ1_PANRE
MQFRVGSLIEKRGHGSRQRCIRNRPGGAVLGVSQPEGAGHADSIYHGIADHLPMVIFISSYLIVSLSVCFYIQWDVTLVMFSALPLLILTRMIFSKWFCKTLDEEVNLQNKMTNLVTETFSCIRTVIAFSAQRQTINKYERIANEHGRMTEERLRASSVYDALAQVLLTELIFTAALCYGMWRVGNDNPGRLAALAINMLYMCVTSISIGFHWNGVSNARQNAAEMRSILLERPMIESDKSVDKDILKKAKNTKDMWDLNVKNGSTVKIGPCEGAGPEANLTLYKAVPKGQGTIRFNDVHFCYPSRPDIEVLKGVTLDIKQGEHVAIVGSSGSGKSTLTALILRFYDPTKGNVHLDDEDLRLMNPDAIRAEIGLVSQEPVLFDGTISDNIRYGKLDATQADINDAARKAEAWQFISALPEGMKTRVGDRGLQLSGGQKQRVAIARAVIRNPSVIIFDEATSALDTKHEGEVQKAIDAASQGVTTITIAHRLSTVKNSDRIIVLEAGEIVEEGPPEQLMSNPNGRFWRMYTDQRLDSVPISTMHLSTHTTGGKLKGKFSMGPTDLPKQLLDPESRRRAWARSSLGANKRLGKSYSVLSTDRQKLTLPVMSKKRSRLDKSFKTNVMEIAVEEKSFDEDFTLPGKATNLSAVWRLIKSFKEGYTYLAAAIPVTILRGLFFLLVCFEVASVLEIAMAPDTQVTQQVLIVAAVYIALIIIKTMFEAVGRLFVALYGHGFCVHMRGQMFRKLLRHGAAYFDEEQNTPGKLVHKVMTDTASLNRILGDKLDLLLPAVICSFVSVSIALWINWKLALFCGFQFPAFFMFRLVELRETSKRQRQMIEEEKKAANLATVVLSNMSTIKAYTLQEHFDAIFYNALKPLQSAMKRQSCISAFVFACQFSFTYILIAITLHIGKVMMLSNEITPFDYLRVVLLTQFGANFISQLIASVSDLTRARVAAENILAVINEPPTDMDNLTDEGLRPRVVGRIALQNVEFRYPSRPIVPILKNLTIQVAPGQSVAIVGPSGSGKSSVIAMFHRMYTPTSGQVLVDNYNVRSINPNYLRRVVVSVGQEPTLFSFTIKENITYGLCDDEFNMEKIIKAAKIAHIHDFIKSLPNGYETEVGEFGAQLSGGQKQRIAIARAMVRDPKVLLLDEATAALDATSEKAVQEALESASRHCTCIHVAHRLSSIRTVDKIIVLVEGEIAEQGTHQELMEAKGLYYEMNQLEL